jgi:hypothetical protein
MQNFTRFTLSARANLFFCLSKMHIVCYVLHAKFDVLAIIHVILLNIPDNYDKIRSIRRRSIGSHKIKMQKMHVLCQHI